MPEVKMNLRYKPLRHITHSDNYLYHVPKVFHDSLNFNWADRDYIITSDDRHFLSGLNNRIKDGMITIPARVQGQAETTVEQQTLTEDDFERFIDLMEKIVFKTKIKTEKVLLDYFYSGRICDEHFYKKFNKQVMSRELIQYWNLGRGKKKRVAFIRKFWENPDTNDTDPFTAFKKRPGDSKM